MSFLLVYPICVVLHWKFELQNLGFKIGDNGKKLTVELVRFYNDFKMGFFAGDAVADGLINVAIKDKSGDLLFSKSYEGGAIEPNIQLALGHNAEIALKKTMANIVEKIAHDKTKKNKLYHWRSHELNNVEGGGGDHVPCKH